MKFEAGCTAYRRRVSDGAQGRLHTSAAGVLVYRSSRKSAKKCCRSTSRIWHRRCGRPARAVGINTTDSAVRIAICPTGDRRHLSERTVTA